MPPPPPSILPKDPIFNTKHLSSLLPRLLSTTTTETPNSPSKTLTLTLTLTPTTDDDPVRTISNLWIRSFSRPLTSPFPDLSGFLKNPHLWSLAHRLSSAHSTGSLPPLSSPLPPSLLSLRHSVLSGSFRWGSSSHSDPSLSPKKRRTFDAQSHPLSQDCVVQELLLLLLEPVFEPRFSRRSHGYRPGRNPHTALRTIRSNFAGYLWFIKADLSTLCAGFDSRTVVGFVEKTIRDRKVLSLIRSAVKAAPPVEKDGILERNHKEDKLKMKRLKRKKVKATRRRRVLRENEPKPDPYWLRVFDSFAPEEAAEVPEIGRLGILSPLIVSVCLNELDVWLEGKIEAYFHPSKLDSIWRDSMDDGCHNPSWPEFVPYSGREKTRRMDFVRYGMHILIGIRGPREDAVRIREELVKFCESKYGVKLENSQVKIEHISRGIQFLDHVICRRVVYPTLRYTGTGGKIVSKKGAGMLLSVTASLPQCITQFRKLELVKGDRDPEPLPCVAMFYSSQAHTNSQMNKFLEAMADWYRYADNRKKIVAFCAYVIRSSLAKLYAARYRLKSRAKVYRLASRDLSQSLIDKTRKDVPEYSYLLRMGLVDGIGGVQFSRMPWIPSCDYTPFPRNWVPDHERVLREYIKLQDPKFFCELYKLVRRRDFDVPQDDMSRIVWDCKTHGIRSGRFSDSMKKLRGFIPEGSNNTRVAAT